MGRLMRVVHLTDLHVMRPPAVGTLFNKRLAGAVNLYLMGRSHHFTAAAQAAAVAKASELAPDLVVCTGDFTATALEEEFVGAKELLADLGAPLLAIPGNHDCYTGQSVGRYARHFGESPPVRVEQAAGATWVLVDVCHPDWLSRGWLGEEGRRQLDAALGPGAIVMIHYPLRNRRGERYGPYTRACVDAEAIEALCVKHKVGAALHGHEHHGFRTEADGVPIYDPGASGYAYLPDRGRTAHFNVYTLDAGRIVTVERYRFDGAAFVPEPGGAYATGA